MSTAKSLCSSSCQDSCDDACLMPSRRQNDLTRSHPSTSTSGARPKSQGNKKCQKTKCETDRQIFKLMKLKREIDQKAQRGFPSPCLRSLQSQLAAEQKKVNSLGCRTSCKPTASCSKVSAFSDLDFCESILSDNESLNNERIQLHEELLCKDDTLQQLEDTISSLQCQMINVCHENKKMAKKLTESQSCESQMESQCGMKCKIQAVVSNNEKLACNIHQLESNVAELRNDLHSVKKEKKIAFNLDQEPSFTIKAENDCPTASQRPKTCPSNPNEGQAAAKLKCLESQYTNLQLELCRKEKESKEMVERMKKCLDTCKGDKERAENEALKNRADELVVEISDYKVFIKELQEQVDMYREKFMKAQEKVEYQRYLIESLEISNKDVEAQINEEIKKIKCQFQGKLAELCPYPKKYEDARCELIDAKERISLLEADLKATVTALGKALCDLKTLKQQPDESLEKKYKKLQCEVEMLKKKSCDVKATKECLEDKLTGMKNELEELRKDSSKIISTTKCCAEKNRQLLHQHINGLEVELAQSRASAALSLTEKEDLIKKMKNELASLCGHFNDCQGQIKQLKNQVTYLTNQRHDIRPEDLNKIDYCYPDC